VNITGDTTILSGCSFQTVNTGVTANVNGVVISGCRISSFNNGSANNANYTRIAACTFGSFDDSGGFSTYRDVYTMENVTANWACRGSRHYHNEGATGTIIGTLQAGPLDGYRIKATCMEEEIIRLDCGAGDYIVIGDETSSAGGTVESETPYSSIEFMVIEKGGADYWIAVNAIGTWTLA